MAHFRCLIRGEGFLGILEGRDGPIGFYVNRPVEAVDAEQARRDEMDEIEASELPLIGQAFVVFPDKEAGAE
jgi:hypothetical protein